MQCMGKNVVLLTLLCPLREIFDHTEHTLDLCQTLVAATKLRTLISTLVYKESFFAVYTKFFVAS